MRQIPLKVGVDGKTALIAVAASWARWDIGVVSETEMVWFDTPFPMTRLAAAIYFSDFLSAAAGAR